MGGNGVGGFVNTLVLDDEVLDPFTNTLVLGLGGVDGVDGLGGVDGVDGVGGVDGVDGLGGVDGVDGFGGLGGVDGFGGFGGFVLVGGGVGFVGFVLVGGGVGFVVVGVGLDRLEPLILTYPLPDKPNFPFCATVDAPFPANRPIFLIALLTPDVMEDDVAVEGVEPNLA